MWYIRNKYYSETAVENLQEAKIACDAESPWTYNTTQTQMYLFRYIYFDIFSVSQFTLKNDTGVPENYVF